MRNESGADYDNFLQCNIFQHQNEEQTTEFKGKIDEISTDYSAYAISAGI